MEALKEAIGEQEAEIAGLESALDRQGRALRRARRLYAELGNTDVDVRHPGERSGADYAEYAADGPPERGRRERTAQLRPRTDTSRREVPDGSEPKLFGLGRAEMKEIAALVKDVLRDQPTPDTCADTDEPGGGEQPDGDRGAS